MQTASEIWQLIESSDLSDTELQKLASYFNDEMTRRRSKNKPFSRKFDTSTPCGKVFQKVTTAKLSDAGMAEIWRELRDEIIRRRLGYSPFKYGPFSRARIILPKEIRR